MPLQSINPVDSSVIAAYPEFNDKQVNRIIDLVNKAFGFWWRTSFAERAELMMRAGEILRAGKEDYARLMAVEMGKPITQGRAEAEKCAWVCEYYAENAEQFLRDQPVSTDASRSYVTFQPLGPVLAVMPWNFPFWQVFRFAAPALMAGNVALLKHSSNVQGCALAIEQVFRTAGFPEDVFRTLVIGGSRVKEVIEHPMVKAVTLTGSTPAGRAVAAAAGAALKKTVLELGGSDPYVVLADADLKKTAATCASARLINSGQSCIAAKRFVVVKEVIDRFTDLLVESMKTAVVGNPLKEETTVGPQARIDLRDELHAQVEKSMALGAVCLLGGQIPEGPGAFYPPTVLTNVTKGMPAYEEELFGPVAAIIRAENTEDAIRIANDSQFGLGAAVFSANVEEAERIAAREIEAGCCFVNDFVRSDPRLPFGGIKESGYGRELSVYGIKEFVNIKTVYVA